VQGNYAAATEPYILTADSMRSSWATNQSHQSIASVQSSMAWDEEGMGVDTGAEDWESGSPRSARSVVTYEALDRSIAMTPRLSAAVVNGRSLTLSSLKTERGGAPQQAHSPFTAAGAVAAAAIPPAAPATQAKPKPKPITLAKAKRATAGAAATAPAPRSSLGK
jgi:hypothetical protein